MARRFLFKKYFFLHQVLPRTAGLCFFSIFYKIEIAFFFSHTEVRLRTRGEWEKQNLSRFANSEKSSSFPITIEPSVEVNIVRRPWEDERLPWKYGKNGPSSTRTAHMIV